MLSRSHTISLNCAGSMAYYADSTDIMLLDVYPIGISTAGCSQTYGCCGCDDCEGNVGDVVRRLRAAAQLTGGGVALGFVAQAFGRNEEHWQREPTAAELRVMTYASLVQPGRLIGASITASSLMHR